MEVGDIGIGSGSQAFARVIVTLHVGSFEDGGGSQEGGDQELKNIEKIDGGVMVSGEWKSEGKLGRKVRPVREKSRSPWDFKQFLGSSLGTPTTYNCFVQWVRKGGGTAPYFRSQASVERRCARGGRS